MKDMLKSCKANSRVLNQLSLRGQEVDCEICNTEVLCVCPVQVTSSQEPQCTIAASSSETSKPLIAETAQHSEDAQSAQSTEEEVPQSEVSPVTISMHPPPQQAESSQQHLQTVPGQGSSVQAATKQNQDVMGSSTAHDGSAEASGQERHESDALQHEQSAHSLSSEEVLGMGLQWLQSAYKGWTAKIETCELPVLPAEPEGLEPVRSLLSGMQQAGKVCKTNHAHAPFGCSWLFSRAHWQCYRTRVAHHRRAVLTLEATSCLMLISIAVLGVPYLFAINSIHEHIGCVPSVINSMHEHTDGANTSCPNHALTLL